MQKSSINEAPSARKVMPRGQPQGRDLKRRLSVGCDLFGPGWLAEGQKEPVPKQGGGASHFIMDLIGLCVSAYRVEVTGSPCC